MGRNLARSFDISIGISDHVTWGEPMIQVELNGQQENSYRQTGSTNSQKVKTCPLP
jgi:hypothetical protein